MSEDKQAEETVPRSALMNAADVLCWGVDSLAHFGGHVGMTREILLEGLRMAQKVLAGEDGGKDSGKGGMKGGMKGGPVRFIPASALEKAVKVMRGTADQLVACRTRMELEAGISEALKALDGAAERRA